MKFVLCFCLVAAPIHADVIAPRHENPVPQRLPPSESTYFTTLPERVQFVGQSEIRMPEWYDVAFLVTVALALAAGTVYLSIRLGRKVF